MTATDRGRRSDSLYYDRVSRRELCNTVANLETDNAKLRKLVRFIMHQCNDGNPRCDECVGWNDGECVALLRMSELGIEVDE